MEGDLFAWLVGIVWFWHFSASVRCDGHQRPNEKDQIVDFGRHDGREFSKISCGRKLTDKPKILWVLFNVNICQNVFEIIYVE